MTKLREDFKRLEQKVRELEHTVKVLFGYHDRLVNKVDLLIKATGHSMHYVQHVGEGHWEVDDD